MKSVATRSAIVKIVPGFSNLSRYRRFATTAMASPEGSGPNFPFRRPFSAEPPVEFAEMRREAPVAKVSLWDGSQAWLVSRHADVCAVLGDDRFSKVRTQPNFPELGPGGKAAAFAHKATFVDLDPPEHTKQRAFVDPYFTRANIESMLPVIQMTVDDCIKQLKTHGGKRPVDFIEQFALRVPSQIIFGMLGVPEKDMELLIGMNAVRTSGSTTSAQAANASKELTDYLEQLVTFKTKNPADDLISKLLAQQVKPGHLSCEDLVNMSFLLLVAGNATMVNMIALGVLTLLQHPDQLTELKNEPSLSSGMVEELLRYHTASAMATRRLATADITVAGQVIKAGEGVIASNQSANRDENVFKDAPNFNIHNDAGMQLGFGHGTHACIAQWLARAELQCVFGTLFQKLPDLKLAVPFEEVKYTEASKDVGITELPVTW